MSVLSSTALSVPCGLWQSTQDICPSGSGMCERRLNWLRISLWQVAQVSLIDCLAIRPSVENLPIGLWQSLQDTSLRWCTEPSQWSRGPPEWQPRQPAAWTWTGVPPSWVKAMIAPFSAGSCACREPAPWQASQVGAAGLAASATSMPREWMVWAKFSLSLAWQAVHTAWPTGLASGLSGLAGIEAWANPGTPSAACAAEGCSEPKWVAGSLLASKAAGGVRTSGSARCADTGQTHWATASPHTASTTAPPISLFIVSAPQAHRKLLVASCNSRYMGQTLNRR